jgi:hypothetical protein
MFGSRLEHVEAKALYERPKRFVTEVKDPSDNVDAGVVVKEFVASERHKLPGNRELAHARRPVE